MVFRDKGNGRFPSLRDGRRNIFKSCKHKIGVLSLVTFLIIFFGHKGTNEDYSQKLIKSYRSDEILSDNDENNGEEFPLDMDGGDDENDKYMQLNLSVAVKQQFFNFSSDLGDCNHISIPSDLFIPIFVLSRDRVDALKKSVETYQQTISSPYDIIVLDHKSTYPPMINYLKRMQDEKQFTVHFLQNDKWDDALSESSRFIEQYLKDHPHAEYYVFTDSDIAFYHTQSDVLLFYAANLASCPKIEVVGPALKISDIPDHYNFGEASWLEGHKIFWSSPPYLATWKGIGYHVVKQPIDTTFSMRRRNTIFKRMIDGLNTLRCYAPYVATHTDWYLNSSSLPQDKIWYKDHLGVNKDVNHH